MTRRLISIVLLAALAVTSGCGGSRPGPGAVPAGGARAAGTRAHPMLRKGAWIARPLATPVAMVGGATSDSSGAWVSDATSGTLQRVTASGETTFTTAVSNIYGLNPGPDGIVFDYPSGYGDQPDTGSETDYPVPIPSGTSFSPSEIGYDTTLENVFLGGYLASGPNCTDGIDVVPAGGTTSTGHLGNGYSTPCGPTFLQFASSGSVVWFSEGTTTKHLSYLSTSTGRVTDRPLPAAAAGATPGDLAAGPNGDTYFSLCGVTDPAPAGNAYLVRVNANTQSQTLFSTYSPCANTRDSMVYDPHNTRVWIANDTNTLTAVHVTDGAVSTYTLTGSDPASSGFLALTLGPDDYLWGFRNQDASANAYPPYLIAANPAYAYSKNGAPVAVTISEQNYGGSFTYVISGSPSCQVSPGAGNQFSVSSPANTACTIAFSDTIGIGTVYVPVVTHTGSNIPPQPHTP